VTWWQLLPSQFGDNPDKYPLPNMQDLSNGLHGCNFFSKMDLVKGHHQIPVAAADIPKMAIITPVGLLSISSCCSGCLTLHRLFNE
jgi:hypothetical protein